MVVAAGTPAYPAPTTGNQPEQSPTLEILADQLHEAQLEITMLPRKSEAAGPGTDHRTSFVSFKAKISHQYCASSRCSRDRLGIVS